MEKQDENFRKDLEYMLRLLKRVEYLENKAKDQLDQISALEDENRKLKYEYPDSKRNRDKPLPYKWKYDGERTYLFCPKCEMAVSNWQSYCHACGQKLGKKVLPEMEMKDEGQGIERRA